MDLASYPLATGSGVVLAVSGEIDLHTAPQLNQRLTALAGTGAPIVVDLTDVAFLDSSALGALVAANRTVRERDGYLAVSGPQPHVAKVLALTRMSEVIDVFDSVSDAEDAISRRSAAAD